MKMNNRIRPLVDCFLGFNEIRLAEFRILFLSSLVQHTIIAESALTHSGNYKPFYFESWLMDQPSDLRNRVSIVKIDLSEFSPEDSWEREIASREFLITEALKRFPEGKFILSDLDEIPSLEQLMNFQNGSGNFHFRCRTSYRSANLFVGGKHDRWDYGVFLDNSATLERNGSRFGRLPLIEAKETGSHLSYLGMDAARLEMKLNSFAHTEFANANVDYNNLLQYCESNAIDHIGRIRSQTFGLLTFISSDKLDSFLLHQLEQFEPKFFLRELNQRSFYWRVIASGVLSFCQGKESFWGPKRVRAWLLRHKFQSLESPSKLAASLLLFVVANVELLGSIAWNLRRLMRNRK